MELVLARALRAGQPIGKPGPEDVREASGIIRILDSEVHEGIFFDLHTHLFGSHIHILRDFYMASRDNHQFDHIRRNADDKYDYIKSPKSSGYRGIHDVYECHVKSAGSQAFNGLYVEIQYRTLVQHAWATAGEVIGLITKNKPKFGVGNRLYGQSLLLASEILSRAFEGDRGYLSGPDDHTICLNFALLDRRTAMLDRLRRLKGISVSELLEGNPILMFSGSGDLTVFPNKNTVEGLRTLFRLERQFPARDIVLVRSVTGNGVRIAFKNYFSDALDFIALVEEGCQKLAGETLKEILEPKNRMSQVEATFQKVQSGGWGDPEQNTFFPA